MASLTGIVLESEATAGIEARTGDRRLVFISGATAVTPAMRERCMRADVVLFDGTLYTDDKMQNRGVSQKTGRRMGRMPMPNGSIVALRGVDCRRIYIHINNTNPVLIAGSPARQEIEAAGWEIAHYGMEIVL